MFPAILFGRRVYCETSPVSERMVDQVFRAAYSSVAVLTVFAVQDILKLGNWARMNLPSSMGNNWKWRMQKGQLGQHELECMRYLASVFDRERK